MITIKIIHGERHTKACLRITEQSGIEKPLIRTVNPAEEMELTVYPGRPLVLELEEIHNDIEDLLSSGTENPVGTAELDGYVGGMVEDAYKGTDPATLLQPELEPVDLGQLVDDVSAASETVSENLCGNEPDNLSEN